VPSGHKGAITATHGHHEQAAAEGVYAGQRHNGLVVRGGVEPPTFRLQADKPTCSRTASSIPLARCTCPVTCAIGKQASSRSITCLNMAHGAAKSLDVSGLPRAVPPRASLEPGTVIIDWRPCECRTASAARGGHLEVICGTPGCSERWQRPRHEPLGILGHHRPGHLAGLSKMPLQLCQGGPTGLTGGVRSTCGPGRQLSARFCSSPPLQPSLHSGTTQIALPN
jgi:hypothetical protein